MNSNEMIDRYVNEVGENLPRKMRADIEMELRSLLLDALEERAEAEPSAKETAAFLQEFGSPETIAAQYRPAESLIGPKLFPVYKVVVTITVSIIGVLHLLWLGLVLWQNAEGDLIGRILEMIFSFGRSAILNAGIVTFIFAMIERVAGDSLEVQEKKAGEWDPFDLPPVKDPNRVNRGELAVGIVFGVLFLAWLNVFPDWFGWVNFGSEDPWFLGLVTAELIALIPWFSASLLLDVVLKTIVFIQGHWSRGTRWLEVGTSIFGLYVAYLVFNLEEISVVPFFTTMAKSIMAIVILIGLIDVFSKLFRLLLGRPFKPHTFIKSKLA
ncbi:MAG: hypothetical protein H6653_11680 [Ardenticatenaceae bacterium]|nr:hypothetical protein [Ardenticatenaceae bacterium]